MAAICEIGIEIREGDAEHYQVQLRIDFEDSEIREETFYGMVPKSGFVGLETDYNERTQRADYGKVLTEALLADKLLCQKFQEALSAAERESRPIRLYIAIDESAKELNDRTWESLGHPIDQSWLTMDESIWFSRDLGRSKIDATTFKRRPRGNLRALIAIANPSDLGEGKTYSDLKEIDVPAEVAAAKDAMTSLFHAHVLTSKVTIDNLVDEFRKPRGYDILYLICHGNLVVEDVVKDGVREKVPRGTLWLEAPDGTSAPIVVDAFVKRFAALSPENKPRLAVLLSCDSGGAERTPNSTLAALGPRLAVEAGIPAVVAMQGRISMDTGKRFMARFFAQLNAHGQIDQAMAAARGEVNEEPDAWMPVLYSRLKDGRIWKVGWANQERAFRYFETLAVLLKREEAVAIIGPGVLNFFTGPRGTFPERWAKHENVPFSKGLGTNLPQVAQHIMLDLKRPALEDHFEDFVHTALEEYFEKKDIPFVPDGTSTSIMRQRMRAVAEWRYEHAPDEDALYQLAQLPFSVYVTANPDTLLYDMLVKCGKKPQEGLFLWNPDLDETHQRDPEFKKLCDLEDRYVKSLDNPEIEEKYIPSPGAPLVYYLFGRLDYPKTLVLAEDDFFDYLLTIDVPGNNLATRLRSDFKIASLLFIGFTQDDWTFRVLLRSLRDRSSGRPRNTNNYPLIAGQLDPDFTEHDVERMRYYLEAYFDANDVDVYWGDSVELITELAKKYKDIKGKKAGS
jgi:hypothetical protein